jgi:LuxR family maltose regulon positive regulatory protein
VLVRGLIQMALANSYSRLGDFGRAIDAFEAAIPLHWEAGNLLAVFIAANDIVLLARPLGRLDRAEVLCQQLLERARRAGLAETAAAGVPYLGLASVRLQRGQWGAAADMLRQAFKLGARSGLRSGLRTDILAQQVETGLACVGLDVSMGQAPPVLASELGDLAAVPPPTLSRLAYLLVEQGQLEQALPVLRQLETSAGQALQPEQMEWRLVRVYHQVMLGIKQRHLTALSRAEAEATALAKAAESLGWSGYLSEILALRALAAHSRRDLAAALADLERALALAENDQQVMLFVGKGRPMEELLTEALRQGLPHASYAQCVLDRFPSAPVVPRPATLPGLAEPLTEREIEVLRLMADSLTYEAIAQRLVISVNTVRYHVKGLYGKLGASSRADAIARGRELHLI